MARRRYMGDYEIGLGRHHRRRHRRHMHGLFGLGDPGLVDDLKDVAIGIAAGTAGVFLWDFAKDSLPATVTPGTRNAIRGVLGVLGGTLLSKVQKPAGIGLGATLGAVSVYRAVKLAQEAAPAATHGLDAYTWSRSHGRTEGLGYRDPYSFSAAPKPTYYGWGLGRTRVIEQDEGGREFSAYTYSRRHGRSE